MSLFGQSNNSGSLFGGNNNQQQSQQQQQNKPSLFGSATQSSSAGTLFGTSQAQPTSGASPFGLSIQTSQPQSAGGLFGGGATNNQSSNTGGGLFGSGNNNAQSSAPSLFGSTTQTSGQTGSGQTGGGLFGGTNNNNAQSSAPSLFGSDTQTSGQAGGGLFGGGQQQNAQQSGGGLFGSSTTQQQQPQQQSKPSLSLFGTNTQTQNTQQQKPSLFGASTNNTNTQQPGNSLYGGSTAQNQVKPFSLSLGQPTTNQQSQQNTVPGVRIDVSNLRGTTRFSDLHESLQEEILKIEAFIAQQISYKEQCEALMPAHGGNVASVAPDVDYVRGRCEAVEAGIDNDGAAIKGLKGLVATDADDARRVFRAVENLKLPSQYQMHAGGGLSARGPGPGGTPPADADGAGADAMDLTSYFDRVAGEMATTLAGYTGNMAEIERHVGTVEAGTVAQGQALLMRGAGRSAEDQVRELAGVLREFEQGILGVAGRVGQAREGVEGVIARGQR